MSDTRLTLDRSGQSVALTPGDTVTLVLPQSAGTSFLWHLDPSATVEVVSDRVITGEPVPGAEAAREIRLRPLREGRHEITLWRHRPWESVSEADATFHATMSVSGPR